MIKGIAFSCYPVADMARARAFYEGVLGLTPAESFGESWHEYAVGDATFALVTMSDTAPECFKGTRGTTTAFEVDDLDAAMEKMRQNNVPIRLEPYTSPICRMAVVADPDDNLVVLHQLHPKR